MLCLLCKSVKIELGDLVCDKCSDHDSKGNVIWTSRLTGLDLLSKK